MRVYLGAGAAPSPRLQDFWRCAIVAVRIMPNNTWECIGNEPPEDDDEFFARAPHCQRLSHDNFPQSLSLTTDHKIKTRYEDHNNSIHLSTFTSSTFTRSQPRRPSFNTKCRLPRRRKDGRLVYWKLFRDTWIITWTVLLVGSWSDVWKFD